MNALITITGLGALAMLAEIFNFKKILPGLMLAGIVLALGVTVADWNTFLRYYNDMMYMDNYAIVFSALLIAITLLWLFISGNYFRSEPTRAEHYAIIMFALAGGIIMVSYADLSMLFLGLEILSISFYVLAGSNKTDLRSNEAGFKYFIMGAFATGFLLFGIALLYGAAGTFNLQKLAEYVMANTGAMPVFFYAGLLLVLVGLAFKVSAVPFHSWAPDVYEGSPTLITALMATLVKTAAFAAFYRLFSTCFIPISDFWINIIWVMAALSMLTGNIMAVSQTSFKRLLAYSSIAHAGYMMLAVIAVNELSAPSLFLYLAAYSVASISAFAILYQVSLQTGDQSIDGMKGFAKDHPVQAFVLVVTMLSMAGIPPMAGFFAKYYLFYAALQAGYTGLVLVAVLSSLIGVYYYLRIIFTIYQKTEDAPRMVEFSFGQTLLLAVTAVLTLLFGVKPDLLTSLLS